MTFQEAAGDDGPGLYGDAETIKVVARVRPSNELELDKDGGADSCLHLIDDRTVTIDHEHSEHTFGFDHVFSDFAGQDELFEQVGKPMVAGVLNGFHGAILAYGQTGSGKTYTMQGPPPEEVAAAAAATAQAQERAAAVAGLRGGTPAAAGAGAAASAAATSTLLAPAVSTDLRGIIPRMLSEIFDRVEADTHTGKVDYDIRASFIEIYNETMFDLVVGKASLRIYEDQQRGLFITGATEVPVTSETEAMRVYNQGIGNRKTFQTNMNATSSRSHAIFLLTIARQDIVNNVTKFSQLYLVDLAGSEKVWKTGAEGDRLNEAKFINRSLLALGQVIYKLSSKDPADTHVPYRDSKLTRLLQNSLGGNARTCLIINLSPSGFNAQETLSTLRFGDRTKRIQNRVTANEVMGIEQLEEVLKEAHQKVAANAARIEKLESEHHEYLKLFAALGMRDDEVRAMMMDTPRPVSPRRGSGAAAPRPKHVGGDDVEAGAGVTSSGGGAARSAAGASAGASAGAAATAGSSAGGTAVAGSVPAATRATSGGSTASTSEVSLTVVGSAPSAREATRADDRDMAQHVVTPASLRAAVTRTRLAEMAGEVDATDLERVGGTGRRDGRGGLGGVADDTASDSGSDSGSSSSEDGDDDDDHHDAGDSTAGDSAAAGGSAMGHRGRAADGVHGSVGSDAAFARRSQRPASASSHGRRPARPARARSDSSGSQKQGQPRSHTRKLKKAKSHKKHKHKRGHRSGAGTPSRSTVTAFLGRMSDDQRRREERAEVLRREVHEAEHPFKPDLVARPPRPGTRGRSISGSGGESDTGGEGGMDASAMAQMASDVSARLERAKLARPPRWVDHHAEALRAGASGSGVTSFGGGSGPTTTTVGGLMAVSRAGSSRALAGGDALSHTPLGAVGGLRRIGSVAARPATASGDAPLSGSSRRPGLGASGTAAVFVRYFDPAQRAYYFCDPATQRTSWTVPPGATIVDGRPLAGGSTLVSAASPLAGLAVTGAAQLPTIQSVGP